MLTASLWILGAIVFGSLWQIEITILNQLNGDYPFGSLFGLIFPVSNWAARDFFYALIAVCFVLTVTTAFLLGRASTDSEKLAA